MAAQTGSVTEQLMARGHEVLESEFGHRTQEVMQAPQETMMSAVEWVNHSIREQPVRWALAGFGIGCIVGAMCYLRR